LLRSKVDALTLEATVAAEEIFGQFRPKSVAAKPVAASSAPPVAAPAKTVPQPTPSI